MTTLTPGWPEERRLRREIDRAVGRALVDHSFAACLLAQPTLAVEAAVCGQPEYFPVCHLQAHDLDGFARLMLDQFWDPARRPAPASQPGNGSPEASDCPWTTACL